ncbi:hypothetical protein OH76DRAFT_467208 [Lentinus brumalis]|uniref:F-box domain-containing protein n=1 Tax=Lentinus brumalis TaxID=2498619 RepID=A0A371DCP1_9APHY|nr:hypothetical protein OH76DRAFT_467208 [Polyporus brumalis]
MDNSVLNIDVFHVIMAYATRHTVSKLMQTCHSLTYEGGRYLLASGVQLRTENDAVSFLSFLFARSSFEEFSSRIQWVRSVVLSFGTAPPRQSMIPGTVYSIFTNLSLFAFNFVHLEIYSAETLLTLDPSVDIPYAIANLTTLGTLSIVDGGKVALNMLGRLQSPLHSAAIFVYSAAVAADVASVTPGERNARWLLEGCGQQLTSLTIDGPLSFSAAGPTYSALRVLSIRRIWPPAVVDYLDAFPHLQHLKVLDLIPDALDEDDIDQHRQNNILCRSHRAADRIRDVRGPIVDLYTLGLSCRAEFLCALQSNDGWDEYMEECLCAILVDTRPVHLTLMITDVALLLSEEFCALCQQEPMQHLESIHLFLDLIPYEYRLLNMFPILEAIHEGVRTMTSLRAFKLTISWFPLGEYEEDYGVDERGEDFEVVMKSWHGHQVPPRQDFVLRDFFASWDPNAFVNRLSEALTGLEAVHVINQGHMYNATVKRGPYDQFGGMWT